MSGSLNTAQLERCTPVHGRRSGVPVRTRGSTPGNAAVAASTPHGIDPPNGQGRRRSPRSRTGSVGKGTAWLVFDAGGDLYQYQCYWFGGSCGDHLLEHSRAATAADAVKWATARTPQARIRLSDHRTYWAGTGPNPGGFAGTWASDGPDRHSVVDMPPSRERGHEQPEPSPARIPETVGARN
jgi:hypothetical protein